jgi:Histidine kinase-, DNA gyrase B-, and HSP90-like ATPase
MKPATKAEAYPTKEFFVSMLTRDIRLEDAILDLLDNCLDGALRMADGAAPDYSKHTIRITLDAEEFSIEDDCGGIPRDIAARYAFKMGRDSDDTRDSESETIGMYGVGMKRAIFKMGQSSTIATGHNGDFYEVAISPEWLEQKEWAELDIVDRPDSTLTSGTRISVTSLFPSVARHFANDAFINDLKHSISEHFTMFLQRGLCVLVNGAPVPAIKVEVLVSPEEDKPAPYIYEARIGEVLVSITVGLNAPAGSSDDDESGDGLEFERNRSSESAGWTVFCNDRAVIVGDKSRLTGWGDSIPLYHGQFSIITGIVEFRSPKAKELPVTTTKRALDTSSPVWLEALVKMKEGMRIWINYTNAWKNLPRSEQSAHWSSAKPLPIREAIVMVSHRSATKKANNAIEYNPQKVHVLPKPPSSTPTSRRVVFVKPLEEIQAVGEFLFESSSESPSTVGARCFELIHAQSKARRK